MPVYVLIIHEGISMGDGRFYAPTRPRPKKSERTKEYEAIFEEAIREAREKQK